MLITVAIFGIVVQSGKAIFTRAIDGTDPKII
jgi:divalent metal cation (Fe/Co/Zn/Cd) transporter